MQLRSFIRSRNFHTEFLSIVALLAVSHITLIFNQADYSKNLIIRDYFSHWFASLFFAYMLIYSFNNRSGIAILIFKSTGYFILTLAIDFLFILFLERLFQVNEYFDVISMDRILNRALENMPWLFLTAFISFLYYKFLYYRSLFYSISHQNKSLFEISKKDRLQFLNSQINSHFLFNAMNTISMQIRKKENSSAIDMIADLSDLLRNVLAFKDRDKHKISEEIGLIEKYISLEQERHPGKIWVSFEIDKNCNDFLIPGFILQPLVENAFKHGLGNQKEMKLIVSTVLIDEFIQLEVENSSSKIQLDDINIEGEGIGIKNIIDRLQNLYGSKGKLTIENKESSVKFKILIPKENAN